MFESKLIGLNLNLSHFTSIRKNFFKNNYFCFGKVLKMRIRSLPGNQSQRKDKKIILPVYYKIHTKEIERNQKAQLISKEIKLKSLLNFDSNFFNFEKTHKMMFSFFSTCYGLFKIAPNIQYFKDNWLFLLTVNFTKKIRGGFLTTSRGFNNRV